MRPHRPRASTVLPPVSLALLVALLTAARGEPAGAAPPARGAEASVALEPGLFRELAWRSIGPANMGGRISDFAAVEKRPATFFVATATGGLFKTANLGTTWTPVFDKQPVQSLGAVAVWQKNPDVVWAGTGEANSRNSSSWGDGIYRSDDGGDHWRNVGLAATSSIARVVPDPGDSTIVYVAALGRLWGDNPERGVFVTRDGGRTWQQSLKVDAATGACDLVMDPSNPRVLYAAMYARRRTPWSFTGGGRTGGVFRTRDGGRSWTKLAGGLPAETGRIGLDVFRKDPRVVYAVVESDEGGHLDEFEDKSRAGGVFRSEDGGDHWTRLSPYTPRPFYFSQIRVQPDDAKRVYLLGTDLWISDDGGVSFRAGGARDLHPDCHAMWIDPGDGDHVMLGTDGGVFVSHDRAATWDFLNNMAIGEFYNLAVDMRDPYWICGGLQDNQSWCGPSRTAFEPEPFLGDPSHAGILNDQWFCLGGGDGFHVAMDPGNPNIVYYESQGAYLRRLDLASNKERNLRPSAKEGEPRFRFNWNAPFLISPHDSTVLWLGGNHVFRLYERGDKWALASPDLSTRDPRKMDAGGSAAETHCTVVTLTESPVAKNLLWAGTDDGKLWVTRDAATWTDLTASLRGVPPGLYMSRIEASHFDPGTAYLAIDGHRTDDFRARLLVTHDFGRSWKSIVGDLPANIPVKVVREDRGNRDLLFVGTERGIYMTLDGGVRWMKLDRGVPSVAVDDILIHPRDRDLIIGTHGRSVYVLDDILAWEHWTARALRDSVTLFPLRPATAYLTRTWSGLWGQRMFRAKNPAFGAALDYFVALPTGEDVSLAVTDSAGRAVRQLTGPGTVGLHRVMWDLQGDPKQKIPRPEWGDQPEFVRPGTYTVTARQGDGRKHAQSLVVRVAPGVPDPGF